MEPGFVSTISTKATPSSVQSEYTLRPRSLTNSSGRQNHLTLRLQRTRVPCAWLCHATFSQSRNRLVFWGHAGSVQMDCRRSHGRLASVWHGTPQSPIPWLSRIYLPRRHRLEPQEGLSRPHKELKHQSLAHTHTFIPMAFETFGPTNLKDAEFVGRLGEVNQFASRKACISEILV